MANLAEAVDATEPDWIISADLDDDIDFLTVEDEIVHVTANFPAQYQAATGTTSAPRIRVERGAGGTTAASHADTTALTPLIPPSSSAGAGGVTINLTGTETEPGNFFRGDEDPADTPAYLAILEPGDLWTDTTFGPPFSIKQRNFANDGWDFPSLVVYDAVGNQATIVNTDVGSVSVRTMLDGVTRTLYQATDLGSIEVVAYDEAQAEIATLALNPNEDGKASLSVPGQILTLDPLTGLTYTGDPATFGQTIVLDGESFGRAAFVDPDGALADDIANALINAGLMEGPP